ncbi:MAG: HAMP domain-containing protein, partial [Gemmatimonadetes bacterium]|nr:HAMP domain-containing protein [Gemmatimonadota bacterium]
SPNRGRLTAAGPYALWGSWVLLIAWTRLGSPWLLVPGAILAALPWPRPSSWRAAAARGFLLTAIALGFFAGWTDRRFGEGWGEYWESRRQAVAERLEEEFDGLVQRGDASARRLAAAASAVSEEALADTLEAVLRSSGMAGVAVVGIDGRLSDWRGSHHGRLPAEALDGLSPYSFGETPLFSYLYFTTEIPGGGGTALVAALLRADVPTPFADGLGDFASEFEARTGEAIRITRADRASGPDVLDFGWPDQTLLSITVVEPSRTERRDRDRRRILLLVAGLLGAVWLLLFRPETGPSRWIGGLALVTAAAVFPLDVLLPVEALVDPAAFLLPGPLPMSLGRVFALALALLPFVAMWRLEARSEGLGRALVAGVGLLGFPLVLVWLLAGGSPELVGSPLNGWIWFQLVLTLCLTLLAMGALAVRMPSGSGKTRHLVGGLLLSVIIALSVALPLRVSPGLSAGWVALWSIPLVLVSLGMRGWGDGLSYLRWFAALWVAGTAALPFAWSARTEARMTLAEGQMLRLGSDPDPYVEFLLDRLGARLDSLDRGGASDVELLYQGWRTSGLVEEGSPVLLTLWSPSATGGTPFPVQELNLGVPGPRPLVVDGLLPELAADTTVVRRRLDRRDVLYLVSVPLEGGRLVTGVVPPRRTISEPSSLGPLFATVQGQSQEFLSLVRLTDPPGGEIDDEAVRWARNEEGWRGERVATYPDGPWAAFHTISIPAPMVMFARANLLFALNALILSAVWLVSFWLLRGRPPLPAGWRSLFSSFRGRVTWTLFGFFLLSNAVFGTLAYRTLAGASERTATALAERVVARIAESYTEEGGAMEQLARRVGADLLEYRAGELVGGSVDELIDLGLYDGWVDPDVYRALEEGELERASVVASLGSWQYVLAFRSLPDGDIVASPVPLRAGAAALRRRDVTDLLAFAAILGPILSLGLALLVGRALSRPIQTLQIASERVGSGNLAVHLPEDRVDEFGSVFSAFNRMVLRLGDARSELLQTTRRTEAIVEEAATGVIALDPRGRVTVVNPRAESLLDSRVMLHEPLPNENEFARELAQWLDQYFRAGVREDDADFEWGDRRVRGRARRIAREGSEGGVVVILEDVTDELRSERILAWGEMAKQVAHEVKNPLTPIKLSVQHLRRAWEDGSPEYGTILDRNVGAILGEIDRLAAIAKSFSRFAVPGTPGSGPLESVDVHALVRETLDLYQSGGEQSIRFSADLPDRLPMALCRSDELKEVLVNLLENARQAMADGPGDITIAGQAVADGPGGEPATLALTVEDNGSGIPSSLLPRIFEPQFSTRSTGAGLGLAIVQRLVASWGGRVEAWSEEGKGTRMTLYVPLAPSESQVSPSAKTPGGSLSLGPRDAEK